ncbi:MAG: MMPL family transporter [Deltaproteobacteria bacterium]|nr:MMPL family transporter [Deltaproteobacteria bacterium]MBN2674418.1 MMPL family transporter [Deltaproteobacteria bacterium]
MITLLMRHLAKVPLTYPRWVLSISLLLTVVALFFVPRLHVSTDRNLLAGKDSEEFRRREEVSEMFGTTLISVAVVEASSQEQANRTASQLANQLKKYPDVVKDVFYKADIGFFESRALLFAPERTVEKIVDALNSDKVSLDVLEGKQRLSSLLLAGSARLEAMPADDSQDDKAVEAGLTHMRALFQSVTTWFTDPDCTELPVMKQLAESLQQNSTLPVSASTDGFLVAKDEQVPRLAVLFIQPADDSQSMEVVAPLTDLIRKNARQVAAKNNVRILVSGMPSLATDELRLVTRDCVVAGVVAGLGVILVFMLAFRSIRVSLFVVLPLGVGLVWAAGFTGAVYEHLTMITSYFAAVLFGLGVAFTIHIVARFHEELLADVPREKALENALVGAGPGVLVGGATTALAFLAIVFSDFQGFAEMGVISGVGVTMILLANVTLLPAAMLLWHPGKSVVRAPVKTTFFARLAGSKRIVPIAALVLFVAGVAASFGVHFNYAVESMLPRDSEAVKGIQLLNERTIFSSTYSVAVASSIQDANELASRFEALSTVSRVESAGMFLPEHQHKKVEQLHRIRPEVAAQLKSLHTEWKSARKNFTPSTATSLSASLEEIHLLFLDMAFDAKRANRAETKELQRIAEAARAASEAASHSSNERVEALERMIFSLIGRAVGILASGATMEEFGVSDLPDSIRGRYVSRDGAHYAVIVYPDGDIGEKDFFYKHVDELLSVDPGITGHPVTHKRFTVMVQRGFVQATVLSLLAVVVLVLLDLRSLKGVILGLGPVVFSAGFTALTMWWFDFQLNYANLMALPILIGTAVDYGVHLAHRVKQEGDVLHAVNTTGRAILLSGTTTLIGFGSLILGNHWGVKSLGILLVLGIFFSLLASMVIFPGFFSTSAARRKSS